LNKLCFNKILVTKAPKIVNNYLFGDTIGEGSYGKVKEVLEVHSLVRKAVKIIKFSRLRKIPNGRANVEQELRILNRVQHHNVISLCDLFRDDEKQKLYIIMDYCTGSLQQMLDGSEEKKLPLFQAHSFFTQLIDGLNYLHAHGVIHKDIKPGNLLLTLDGVLKISDFGVAELLDVYRSDDWCKIIQGTPKFQPPEIVSGNENDISFYSGKKVDIWACGVTLYNLISGEYPFEGDVIMHLFDNIANQPLQMPKNTNVPFSLKELLVRMLEKDPEKRISIHEIFRCDWFRYSYEDSARINIPVCNNMPAHRPLSVYVALEQMYGVVEETESATESEIAPHVITPTDGGCVHVSNVDGQTDPVADSKRNKSM
uniref:non-specific serine/threonine protein kinase n=1 Tax=Dracunculus medinensis TaxID=318479 RepID=A0A0N4U1E5_DRAME